VSAIPETLSGLLRHYSPSGQERGAVEYLVSRMQTLGYGRAFSDAAGNAVGILGAGERQMVLLGHIDTVPGEIPLRLEAGVEQATPHELHRLVPSGDAFILEAHVAGEWQAARFSGRRPPATSRARRRRR